MKLILTLLTLTLLSVPDFTGAHAAASSGNEAALSTRRMIVEPSSTTVAKGRVRLTVEPLTREGKAFVGDYQIKVVPYFFKSEKGRLVLEASDEAVERLSRGMPVKFKGTATNAKNRKVKVITGHATPSSGEKGSLSFSVETENGRMLFKTVYQFEG